jgi:hypothetical protein
VDQNPKALTKQFLQRHCKDVKIERGQSQKRFEKWHPGIRFTVLT